MAVLSKRSLNNLVGVHDDLILIINKALTYPGIDFSVIEGRRSIEQHKKNVARGVSWAKLSKHCYDPSCAFDFIPYPFTGWKDREAFDKVAKALNKAAKELKIEARSGGDWNRDNNYYNDRNYDGGHFELMSPYKPPVTIPQI